MPAARDHFADRRQHAQAEDIDLNDAGVFQRFLVPLHDRAVGHGGWLGGQAARQRHIGNDLAAVVDADMAHIAQQLLADIKEESPRCAGVFSRRAPPNDRARTGCMAGAKPQAFATSRRTLRWR